MNEDPEDVPLIKQNQEQNDLGDVIEEEGHTGVCANS